jgi:hypothetical protein
MSIKTEPPGEWLLVSLGAPLNQNGTVCRALRADGSGAVTVEYATQRTATFNMSAGEIIPGFFQRVTAATITLHAAY